MYFFYNPPGTVAPTSNPRRRPDTDRPRQQLVHDNLRHWNNDPNRTRADVLELIDRALALALRDSGAELDE